jgi:hypothetical protein
MPRVSPATKAITNYKKMKVKTTSLPCRVMEAQRLIEMVRLAGSKIQQWTVRKMLEKTKGLEIICKCHDDLCAFLEADSDGTRYCTCTDWESTTRPALSCKNLEVIGHEGNKVFKIGEGFIRDTSVVGPDPDGFVFDSHFFEEYLATWHSANDTEETQR